MQGFHGLVRILLALTKFLGLTAASLKLWVAWVFETCFNRMMLPFYFSFGVLFILILGLCGLTTLKEASADIEISRPWEPALIIPGASRKFLVCVLWQNSLSPIRWVMVLTFTFGMILGFAMNHCWTAMVRRYFLSLILDHLLVLVILFWMVNGFFLLQISRKLWTWGLSFSTMVLSAIVGMIT